MQEKLSIKVGKYCIKGVLESPNSTKLIVLVHGFTGDMQGPENIFEKLSKSLQERGLTVLRFNFRGTPPSEGGFEDMTIKSETKDLKTILKFAKLKGYKYIGLIGESMGGTIIANSFNSSIKAAVFWYPAFDLINTSFKEYFSKKRHQELKEKGFIQEGKFKVGEKFISEIKRSNLFDNLKSIKFPVLFLHGNRDTDVPYQQSERAFHLVKSPKEIHIIKRAEHCFKNEQDKVIELTLNFLKKYF